MWVHVNFNNRLILFFRRFSRKRQTEGFDANRKPKESRFSGQAGVNAPAQNSSAFQYDPRNHMPVIDTSAPPPLYPQVSPTSSMVSPPNTDMYTPYGAP